MINGSSSNWSTIQSGFPHGTVLGPLLCPLFIIDLPSVVSSNAKLFADDSVFHRHIGSSADHGTLQKDLLRLERWAAIW